MIPERKMLDDLIHFTGLTYGGPHNPTDLWVTPDWQESWLAHMREQYKKFNPATDKIGSLLFLEAHLAIGSSDSTEERKALNSAMKSGKVAIVSSHAGIHCPGQDEKWRYKLGNGEFPLVEELLEEMDPMGFDIVKVYKSLPLGIRIPWGDEPLADLDDVWKTLQGVDAIGSPVSYNEDFIVYEKRLFHPNGSINTGHFEFVSVGRLPFFGHSGYSVEDLSPSPGTLGISEWSPTVKEGGILAQYLRDHSNLFKR